MSTFVVAYCASVLSTFGKLHEIGIATASSDQKKGMSKYALLPVCLHALAID